MTSKEEHLRDLIHHAMPGMAEVHIQRPRRVFVRVPREALKNVVHVLAKEMGVTHISSITGRDAGSELEALYHFFANGVVITVRTTCPRDDPTLDTITEIIPGALFYEREVHDLMGIVPKGHPDLRKLVLPDDWEEGHPLRKDWKPVGGEGSG
ncbi:MAG: NADH-quinone oxidoreductase subunit C [Candidatus Thermoplasmatota archaeon]